MSDSFRQVGADLPGGGSSITAAMCKRKLTIDPQPTAIYTVSGNRDALLAGMPSRGDVFETISDVDFLVIKAELDDIEGGDMAEMTISTEAVLLVTYGDPIGVPIYTVQFAELRKAIEQHPCCGTVRSDVLDSRSQPSTFENWQYLLESCWTNNAHVPGLFASIGAWSLEDYQQRKWNGQDEFVMYFPVVTRTLTYLAPPADIGKYCGTRQDPPVSSFPHSELYDWLAGPDELTRSGSRFERKTTWTGVDWVDSKIYPAWP